MRRAFMLVLALLLFGLTSSLSGCSLRSFLGALSTPVPPTAVVQPPPPSSPTQFLPRIVFWTGTASVHESELLQRTARIPVSWSVSNRPEGTNLVFEQVLLDGTIINVELPRSDPWVASAGDGVVAPILPVDSSSIQIRVRLVRLADGADLATESLALVIIRGTPPKRVFEASPDPAPHGGTISLTWSIPGASTVSITRLSEHSQIYLEVIAPSAPAVGSLNYTIPDDYVDSIPFILIADNGVKETLSVAISCPFRNKLTSACPWRQGQIQVAYQPFERGYMIWRSDTREIYVLYLDNEGLFEIHPDSWVEGETFEIGETPPPGKVQPVRGFGKVWAVGHSPYSWVTPSGVRQRLGWALDVEKSFNMAIEIHPHDWNRPDGIILRLPDGSVVILTMEVPPYNWKRAR